MDDTTSLQDHQILSSIPYFELLIQQALPKHAVPAQLTPGKRGRPAVLTLPHLLMSLVVSVLLGMHSYQDLWRRMCSQVIGSFRPVTVTDDAILKRLRQAGLLPLQEMLRQISAVLATRLQPLLPSDLAPFASRIVALDETTWDAVQRHLPHLRTLPDGHVGLRPGKLAGRFDIRSQQWDFVQWREDPQANCKVDICSLLLDLPRHSLLLFDLGYFSFPFFDYLTQMQYWFICRLREKTTYQLVHVFYRHEGILDALVWLGSSHGARCGHLVRLVRFHDGQGLRCYLTNVLDPRQLSLPAIASLYARRWDIELAFLTLKEHLGLHHWWSSQPLLMQQQALLVLIVAQLLQALRVLIAAEAGRDPFEVSLPLLVRYVPQFIQQRQHPVAWVLTYGPVLGFFRPSTRLAVSAPAISLEQMCFPQTDLALTRKARYVEYVPTPGSSSRPKKKSRQTAANSS